MSPLDPHHRDSHAPGTHEPAQLIANECGELEARLARTERRLRALAILFAVAVVLPIAAGAYSTSDEILLRDSATGKVRIVLKANPNGNSFIQLNAADGKRRIYLGESPTGIPNLSLYNQDGISVARDFGP